METVLGQLHVNFIAVSLLKIGLPRRCFMNFVKILKTAILHQTLVNACFCQVKYCYLFTCALSVYVIIYLLFNY